MFKISSECREYRNIIESKRAESLNANYHIIQNGMTLTASREQMFIIISVRSRSHVRTHTERAMAIQRTDMVNKHELWLVVRWVSMGVLKIYRSDFQKHYNNWYYTYTIIQVQSESKCTLNSIISTILASSKVVLRRKLIRRGFVNSCNTLPILL